MANDWLRLFDTGSPMQQQQSMTQQMPMALPQIAQNNQQPPMNALQRFGSTLRGIGQEIKSNSMNSTNNTPSAVQEYVYFSNLPPEEQQNYLRVKRAQQIIDLGGSQGVLNSTAPGLSQNFEKTLPPQMVPENVQQRTAAGARGKVVGETAGAQDKKTANAPDILGLIAEARKVLPEATSGGAATMAKGVSQFFGSSTDASKVDRQLKIIGSALTNYVPRFEGPQSDYDVQTYKDAAGDVANTTLPYEDRLAALDTIETLQKKYTGGAPAVDGNGGGKIRVMNPQTGEAFDIDQGDLQAAQAEGFVPQ